MQEFPIFDLSLETAKVLETIKATNKAKKKTLKVLCNGAVVFRRRSVLKN